MLFVIMNLNSIVLNLIVSMCFKAHSILKGYIKNYCIKLALLWVVVDQNPVDVSEVVSSTFNIS